MHRVVPGWAAFLGGAVGVAALATGTSDLASAGADVTSARPHGAVVRTVVRVDARRPVRRASRLLLGINHHYNANGFGLWDPSLGAARHLVVAEARRAGVQMMRYPGGSVAIPYDWKRAIGPRRGCQIDGNTGPHGSHEARLHGLRFGPDEYMQALGQMHALPFIMVPSMISTPSAAADWVEYMNGAAGTAANPHGGVDWADVRATNGHPAPYAVRLWEIGNEPMHIHSRYWMSSRDRIAVRQYAFGGSSRVTDEWLGRMCAHPTRGVASNGSGGQSFETMYPPVAPASMRLTVGGRPWTEVATLTESGRRAHVYAVEAETGRVVFGDGVHGAIPRRGARVRASYTSVHQGFFDFARQMKEVDPRIRVCASWGRPRFTQVAHGRQYDCLTDHPVTSYRFRGTPWKGPLEGHDRMMLSADDRSAGVVTLRRSLPARVPLLLTEFSALKGDWSAYPTWASSASEAVYMATEWASWMNQGIAVATGGDLLWTNNRAAFGSSPTFTYGAEALTRQAIRPMFDSGGRVLATAVSRNPVRTTRRPPGQRYRALVVSATRTPRGAVLVMVVNRFPLRAVRARILVRGHALRRAALLSTVSGRSFSSAIEAGRRPGVRLRHSVVRYGAHGLVRRLPPASTTLIRLRRR